MFHIAIVESMHEKAIDIIKKKKNYSYEIIENTHEENLINKLTSDLKNHHQTYKIIITKYPGHAQKICEKIQKYKKIIVIGGDGTFNEIINGIMLNEHKPTIGFMPGGTGNAMMHDPVTRSARVTPS